MTTETQHRDPAERSLHMRLFYRDWRPTRFGRWVNRFWTWWAAAGLPPSFQVVLETRGRTTGRRRANAVVTPTVDGVRYLVSMLGEGSEWVKNIEASGGRAAIRHGRRRQVRLTPVPADERAPVLREYVRIATSGRTHFPVAKGAPLAEFEAIAARYPVYRIDPA